MPITSLLSFMDNQASLANLRFKLKSKSASIGSWIQLPCPSSAEILGASSYDWIAVDIEHGSIDISQLPNIFRALELGNTIPLVRCSCDSPVNIKQVLDAGAFGVIIPNVRSSIQLNKIISAVRWPPSGTRGVGFSRANLYGKNFDKYSEFSQSPFVVAMIEDYESLSSIDQIFSTRGLDAALIGPYDLSASMGITGLFHHPDFKLALETIKLSAKSFDIPLGVHIVEPDNDLLRTCIDEGYLFLPYSIDSVILRKFSACPNL